VDFQSAYAKARGSADAVVMGLGFTTTTSARAA
jgi:hypothetical protein